MYNNMYNETQKALYNKQQEVLFPVAFLWQQWERSYMTFDWLCEQRLNTLLEKRVNADSVLLLSINVQVNCYNCFSKDMLFFFLRTGLQQCCQTLQEYGHTLHFSRKGTCQSNRCCPPSIPQISLLFIVIGVLGSGDSLWVIRLTGTCSRLLCNLLFCYCCKSTASIKY